MSYNELFGLGSHSEDASLEGWWPLQDNAASTAVDDVSSNDNNGTLVGGDNTADITTTGPNNWLTAALNLDGSADYVRTASAPSYNGGANVSAFIRLQGSPSNSLCPYSHLDTGLSQRSWDILTTTNGTVFIRTCNGPSFLKIYRTSINCLDGSWHTVGWTFSNPTLRVYVDGDEDTSVTKTTDNAQTAIFASTAVLNLGASLISGSPSGFFDGVIGEACLFSRTLSASEVAELEAGPEPINTVAPALSGTELVGETLTATSGTWALDAPFSGGSNGTVTYSYQWTRSDDDSGTNEADISGATSSTYVLTAADAGKYVRCRVRGTNDGGFDADADTNTAMSGKIATTALLANLDAHYKLDETSGTVVRNEVRTLVLEDHFDSGSTSGTYGDVPTGWAEYRASSPATQVTTYNAGSDTLTLELDGEGTGAGIGGIQKTSFLTVGNRYVLRTRFRVTEAVTGGPFLVVSAGSSVFYDLTTPTVGEWLTVDVNLGSASSTTFTYGVQVAPNTEAATVEIDSITIYQENAGAYVNSPTLGVPGQIGTAVTYNGSTQYANCPVAPTSYPFTMAGWCKLDDLGGETALFSVTDASASTVYWALSVEATSGDLEIYRRNTTEVVTDTGTSLVAGTWYHVAVIFEDETTVHVYVDGELVFSDGSLTSVSFTTNSDALAIGALRLTTPANYFDGSLDDVRLYSRGLESTEIWELYWLGARSVSLASDPAAVDPFSIFTAAVTVSSDISALTLSSTASDYDWSATSLQHDDEGGGAPYAIIRCVTMISDTFGLCANHQPPDADDVIRFRDVNGDLVTATVLTKTQVGSTDIGVVEFSAAVDANVARLPIVYNPEELIGRWIWASQHNGTVGLYRIGTVTTSGTEGIQVDSNPWGVSINSSGRPLLLPLADGTFGLVSTWYSGTGTGPNIGNYINEINAILAGGNESVTIVDAEAVVFPSAGGTGISQSISTGVARPIAQSISQ